MNFVPSSEKAKEWGISQRRVAILCKEGRVPGAELVGNRWFLPPDAVKPKFKGIYNKKMQKYHRCDTIVFGEVLGHEKAFLIQNMCPITEKYMKNEYLDSAANIPVRVDGRLEKELKDKAGKALALQRKGAKLIFPDVLSIEQELL